MSDNKIYVAVVDDDESFARAIGRVLRASGLEIRVYRSAEDFLHDSTHADLDCVVLDIQLGGMSGLELRRRMLVLGWTSTVIFVTALDEAEIRREAEGIGCAAYLRKPCSGRSLVEAIARAVDPQARKQ